MTDAEKELRRMAREGGSDIFRWSRETPPSVILALLDRIEALETEGERRRLALIQEQRYGNLLDQMFPTVITPEATTDTLIRGYGDAIEALQQGAAKAERKGAEEMRSKAEDALYAGDPLDERPEYAERIRNLPLPGDAP